MDDSELTLTILRTISDTSKSAKQIVSTINDQEGPVTKKKVNGFLYRLVFIGMIEQACDSTPPKYKTMEQFKYNS